MAPTFRAVAFHDLQFVILSLIPGRPRWLWILRVIVLPALCAQDVAILPETVVVAERWVEGDGELATWDEDELAAFSPSP